MAYCGIYRIINTINNHFYIGSSNDISRRFKRHISDLNKERHDNIHLQRAWNKYGKDSFVLKPIRTCDCKNLLLEEQKDLDIWVGNEVCYNMRKDAKSPVAIGEKRPLWVIEKIANAQRGVPKFTEEQKKQMSVDRIGRKHTTETIQKMKNRSSSYENIAKAQQFNINRIYSKKHCLNISNKKLGKIYTDIERKNISDGVNKAIAENRYHKNKVPLKSYETIKSLYLSGEVNQRELADRFGINPSSMGKLLKRIGVK